MKLINQTDENNAKNQYKHRICYFIIINIIFITEQPFLGIIKPDVLQILYPYMMGKQLNKHRNEEKIIMNLG